MSNQIHESAKISPRVELGKFNRIGRNVIIEVIGDSPDIIAKIGDNNIINDNTRIFIHKNFKVGDWNVFHNDMLMMAEDHLVIGHNCWFGQNTILDGSGGLEIGNGVRVGMYSQIWTHVASGEQIEGCTLFAKRKTCIADDVWLVGSCIVGSGLKLARRSTALINSVITKDTLPDKVYAGSPAKLMENANFYISKTIDEKFKMLSGWLSEFVLTNTNFSIQRFSEELVLTNNEDGETVVFSTLQNDQRPGVFYLGDKTFNKSNLASERLIYKFLYNNKARFTPKG